MSDNIKAFIYLKVYWQDLTSPKWYISPEIGEYIDPSQTLLYLSKIL